MMKWLQHALAAMALASVVSSSAMAADLDSHFAPKFDPLKLTEWQVTSSPYGGTLLLSDSPETVPADGIMYQDTVNGDVRLFFHHVNGTMTAKKIVVLLENGADEPANVTVYQYGLSGPGLDYLAIGKAAQSAWMSSKDFYLVEVPGKGSAQLDSFLGDAVVQTNMLVNGIYDFQTDKPVTVKVMMLPVKDDVARFAAQSKVLPADQNKLRGTFDGHDRMMLPDKVYNPVKDGPVAITLADNHIDRYARGIDATDRLPVVNYGNYGVVYRVFFPSETAGNVAYYLNPRGGEYGGAMEVKYLHVPKVVETPAGRLSMGRGTENDFAPLGQYASGQSLWFTFSPPGASNLPVKLLMVPQ